MVTAYLNPITFNEESRVRPVFLEEYLPRANLWRVCYHSSGKAGDLLYPPKNTSKAILDPNDSFVHKDLLSHKKEGEWLLGRAGPYPSNNSEFIPVMRLFHPDNVLSENGFPLSTDLSESIDSLIEGSIITYLATPSAYPSEHPRTRIPFGEYDPSNHALSYLFDFRKPMEAKKIEIWGAKENVGGYVPLSIVRSVGEKIVVAEKITIHQLIPGYRSGTNSGNV